ncbi:S-layer homology domain-containing protein [Sporosarcina newyorkensis]|uniref:S-layer homology domain-containing protein n=1 Tax=Sporosarcina newyorkensis TaxID=759851 RepID=UPI003D043BB2
MNKKILLSTLAALPLIPVIAVQAEAADFKDINSDNLFFPIIKDMRDRGVINGYPDGTFRPSELISRKHIAILIDRTIDLKPTRKAAVFKDVPKTHPYYNAVQKLYRAGIIDGDNGYFYPEAPITHAQMSKILVNAYSLKVKAPYDFIDMQTDHWAKPYARALYSNGIFERPDGRFQPNQQVTRLDYTLLINNIIYMDKNFVAKPIHMHRDGFLPRQIGIKIPNGWTNAKVEVHMKRIRETVFEHKYKTQQNFGRGTLGLDTASDRSYVEKHINGIGSPITFEEWIDAINYAIKTGDVYIDPSHEFAVYATYGYTKDRYKDSIYGLWLVR